MKTALHRLSEPADLLLARLEDAATRDKRAQKNVKIGCGALVAIVFGGLFGLAALADLIGSNLVFLGLLVVVPVIAFIVHETGHDVDDRKLAAATDLVRTLRADVPAAGNIQLEIDFREYTKSGTKVADPAQAKVKGVKVEKYQQKWLEVRTTLADGTQIDAAITDRISRKSKPKRKYVKVKEAFVSDVTLGLRLDKRYGDAEAIAPRLYRHPALAACQERARTAKGRNLYVALRTPGAARINSRRAPTQFHGVERIGSGRTILDMLAWVYDGIGRGAKKAA